MSLLRTARGGLVGRWSLRQNGDVLAAGDVPLDPVNSGLDAYNAALQLAVPVELELFERLLRRPDPPACHDARQLARVRAELEAYRRGVMRHG